MKKVEKILSIGLMASEASRETMMAFESKKMAVEGMDCQIKNPRKRFLITMSGGVEMDILRKGISD